MANTPNIDLAKPAGTDHALVSVLNSNSDKIDTFAGTTNQAITKLDGSTTYADAINPDNYTTAGVYHVGIAAAYSPTGVAIYGMLEVFANSGRYAQMFYAGGARTFVRTKTNSSSAWTGWKELITNEDVKTYFGWNTNTISFTVHTEPSTSHGGTYLLLCANQRLCELINVAATPSVSVISGNNPTTVTVSGTTVTITTQNTMWGLTMVIGNFK